MFYKSQFIIGYPGAGYFSWLKRHISCALYEVCRQSLPSHRFAGCLHCQHTTNLAGCYMECTATFLSLFALLGKDKKHSAERPWTWKNSWCFCRCKRQVLCKAMASLFHSSKLVAEAKVASMGNILTGIEVVDSWFMLWLALTSCLAGQAPASLKYQDQFMHRTNTVLLFAWN